MQGKVRASVALDNKRTEIREFDFPAIPSDGGLLKVEKTGVCGSDWPYFLNYPKSKGPLILGHETVGFVSAAGANAAARWGVKEGDRVALEEYLPCGHCNYCRTGDFRLCDATDTLLGNGIRYGSTPVSVAPSLWGGYSEYQYLHPNAVFHKVPAGVPAEQATLALPLGNGVEWAYLQGRASIGEAVVIQGPGQQGLACVIAAKEAGASCIIVTGLSADQHRLALAKEMGAHYTIDIEQNDLLESVADHTGGHMADLVIDCASGGPSTIVSAIHVARKGGRVLLCGRKGRPVPEFDSDLLFRKNLTVKGMRGHSYQAVEIALQILASGRYPLNKMCTHTFSLDQLENALCTVGGEGERNAIHCCVDPWR
ncbi:MAG: alcohol dehydrogenase [Herminiimonas sp.]|jgi:threonine dehydrogenase-like Zn-dependent dehydrogenase|nr:alcohol dehydrogenase [Herminiimonas sp.]